MGSIISQWEAYDILTPPEIVLEAFKHTFHAMDWNPFHYTRKKLVYLHLKDFLSYGCELYLKQPLTPPNTKLLLLTTLKSQSCHQNWSVVNYPQDKKIVPPMLLQRSWKWGALCVGVSPLQLLQRKVSFHISEYSTRQSQIILPINIPSWC